MGGFLGGFLGSFFLIAFLEITKSAGVVKLADFLSHPDDAADRFDGYHQ
jgi:hypothetical protein